MSLLAPVTKSLITNPVQSVYGAGPSDSLLDGLIAWYPLDEASGTRYDAHTNGLDLTDVNTVVSVTGKVGNASQSVATNSERLEASSSTFYPTSKSAFSVVGWVRQDATHYGDIMMSLENSSGNYIWRMYGSNTTDREFYWVIHDPTNVNTYLPGNVGSWYFFCCEGDSGTSRFTLNNSTTDTAGYSPSSLNSFDEVALYNKILTTEEKARLYNSGSGMGYPG
jgi:hypothetical protein